MAQGSGCGVVGGEGGERSKDEVLARMGLERGVGVLELSYYVAARLGLGAPGAVFGGKGYQARANVQAIACKLAEGSGAEVAMVARLAEQGGRGRDASGTRASIKHPGSLRQKLACDGVRSCPRRVWGRGRGRALPPGPTLDTAARLGERERPVGCAASLNAEPGRSRRESESRQGQGRQCSKRREAPTSVGVYPLLSPRSGAFHVVGWRWQAVVQRAQRACGVADTTAPCVLLLSVMGSRVFP
ncbi:MAG TPA: hypothetical protein VKV40_18525 [Ktedonobacteraceae bacterium]|nr:hypothetical protein [Ktedonobacteraceae bacterium]